MLIELEYLYKSFGAQQVLRGINFSEDISTLALIGPSGGGKSTLLRIVGGLEEPTGGAVTVGGKRVDYRASSLPTYRASLGFVFQHAGLFDHLSALENIALPLRAVHEVSNEGAQEQALALLDRFGLADAAAKHPAQLSGGEKQRVAIARAIAPRPQLLLLDEPTSGLDDASRALVEQLLRQRLADGAALLLVTHDAAQARRLAHRYFELADGALCPAAHGSGQSAALDGAAA